MQSTICCLGVEHTKKQPCKQDDGPQLTDFGDGLKLGTPNIQQHGLPKTHSCCSLWIDVGQSFGYPNQGACGLSVFRKGYCPTLPWLHLTVLDSPLLRVQLFRRMRPLCRHLIYMFILEHFVSATVGMGTHAP